MLFFSLFIANTISWWGHSHMVVARIAATYLSKNELQKIENIMNSGTLPKASFVQSSTWQDDLKDEGKFYGMGNWHFVDTPVILPGTNISLIQIAPDTYNVTSYLSDAIQTLENPTTTDLWAFAYHLRSIIHFVGDVHTPHHSCQMYCDTIPTGDYGGNKYYLNCEYGSACNNIHFLWDSAGLAYPVYNPLISIYKNDFEANVTALMKKYPVEHYSNLDIKSFKPYLWANESNKVATEMGYDTPINERPSDEYFRRVQEKAMERIALAGYRLGELLQRLLKDVDFGVETPKTVGIREALVWAMDGILLIGSIVFSVLIRKSKNDPYLSFSNK